MEYNTYLSDEEIDIENEETVELDQYGMPIEVIDDDEEEYEEELRRIVSNKLLSKNSLNEEMCTYNIESKNKIVKEKEVKDPKKKTISLEDLNNLIDKKLEEKKPKKFISKRSMEKKNVEPFLPLIKEVKRQFKPRLTPYLFSNEYKNKKMYEQSKITNIDNLEFPTL